MASRTTELMMMIKAMDEGRLVLLMGPIDFGGGKTYSERAEPAEEEAAFYL
jgi:hypothetical protein